MKSGFIGLIGRPNSGKSTLLNSIIGKKIAITSNKPQTTRNTIQGVYTKEDVQMVFVDTPGIHKPQNKLGKILNKQAYILIDDVDVILFMVDITEKIGSGDRYVIDIIKKSTKPVFLLLNKIDKIPREEILLSIDKYKELYNFDEIIPISALKKDNVDRLIEVLIKYLPDKVKYYEDDIITNLSKSFIISEIIREKVLDLTNDEIPHSITCIIEKIEDKKNVTNINALIIVDRENLKKIIIGKQGSLIKEIGIKARGEIEAYINKKVYLDLYVKVIKKWRDKEKFLDELGYKDYKN